VARRLRAEIEVKLGLENALGGSPLLQQGELDFSPAEKKSILKWALAPDCSNPALKRVVRAEFFPER
jgi:hypothetical protein